MCWTKNFTKFHQKFIFDKLKKIGKNTKNPQIPGIFFSFNPYGQNW